MCRCSPIVIILLGAGLLDGVALATASKVKWMFSDAGVSKELAKLNPGRWSWNREPEDVVAKFQDYLTNQWEGYKRNVDFTVTKESGYKLHMYNYTFATAIKAIEKLISKNSACDAWIPAWCPQGAGFEDLECCRRREVDNTKFWENPNAFTGYLRVFVNKSKKEEMQEHGITKPFNVKEQSSWGDLVEFVDGNHTQWYSVGTVSVNEQRVKAKTGLTLAKFKEAYFQLPECRMGGPDDLRLDPNLGDAENDIYKSFYNIAGGPGGRSIQAFMCCKGAGLHPVGGKSEEVVINDDNQIDIEYGSMFVLLPPVVASSKGVRFTIRDLVKYHDGQLKRITQNDITKLHQEVAERYKTAPSTKTRKTTLQELQQGFDDGRWFTDIIIDFASWGVLVCHSKNGSLARCSRSLSLGKLISIGAEFDSQRSAVGKPLIANFDEWHAWLQDFNAAALSEWIYEKGLQTGNTTSPNLFLPVARFNASDPNGMTYAANVEEVSVFPDDPKRHLNSFAAIVSVQEIVCKHQPTRCEKSNNLTVYIVFRGTLETSDILQDLNVHANHIEFQNHGVGIHTTFNQEMKNRRAFPEDDPISHLEKILTPDTKIVLTGHSMGGAHATALYAQLLLIDKLQWLVGRARLVTFAAPMIFTFQYTSRDAREPVRMSPEFLEVMARGINYIWRNDPVPRAYSKLDIEVSGDLIIEEAFFLGGFENFMLGNVKKGLWDQFKQNFVKNFEAHANSYSHFSKLAVMGSTATSWHEWRKARTSFEDHKMKNYIAAVCHQTAQLLLPPHA